MIIMQIAEIKLKESAKDELTAREYEKAVEWMKGWSVPRNFRAVISESEVEAFKVLREDLRKNLIPSWFKGLKPHHFYFYVSIQEPEDGRFWMPSSIIVGGRREIEEN